MTDESYDPHARMHESFPRADSGTQMADNVVQIRPSNLERDMAGARRQVENERSMRNIGSQGPNVVDTTNLTTFRK